MIDKEVVKAITVYGSALVDQTTQQGIAAAITSTHISNMVFLGVTLGGWTTIILFIGTLLLFIMNVSKFITWSRHKYKMFKLWKAHKNENK